MNYIKNDLILDSVEELKLCQVFIAIVAWEISCSLFSHSDHRQWIALWIVVENPKLYKTSKSNNIIEIF